MSRFRVLMDLAHEPVCDVHGNITGVEFSYCGRYNSPNYIYETEEVTEEVLSYRGKIWPNQGFPIQVLEYLGLVKRVRRTRKVRNLVDVQDHGTISFKFLFDQPRPMQGKAGTIDVDVGVPFIQSIEYAGFGTWTGGRPKQYIPVVDVNARKPLFGDQPQVLKETPDDRDLYEVVILFTNGSRHVLERQCPRDYAHRLTVALNLALAEGRSLMGTRRVVPVAAGRTIGTAATAQRRVID